MRVFHKLFAVGVLFLMLAGCTTPSEGQPFPAPTGDGHTSGSSPTSPGDVDKIPSHGAPKVAHPLDISRFAPEPCSILTSTQAKDLGLPDAGKNSERPQGLECEWDNESTGGRVSIGVQTENPYGLTGAYAAHDRGLLAYFIELPPIEDYPAIASDSEDRRPNGRCLVTVGVTDRLVFNVDLQLSDANVATKDPCEIGAMVASKALQTMKGA